jgi:hypothetical protein
MQKTPNINNLFKWAVAGWAVCTVALAIFVGWGIMHIFALINAMIAWLQTH